MSARRMGKRLMGKQSIDASHYPRGVAVCGCVRACPLGGSSDNAKPGLCLTSCTRPAVTSLFSNRTLASELNLRN